MVNAKNRTPFQRTWPARLKSAGSLDAALQVAVDSIKAEFSLDRVTVMLYHKKDNMLGSVAAAGVPNVDHRNIRTPVVRLPGISSRAVESRCYIENRPIVVRDRSADPQYRTRLKFPHKSFSREFAVFPLSDRKGKLGILAIAVDDHSRVTLTPSITSRVSSQSSEVASLVRRLMPRAPSDRQLFDAVNEILHKDMITTVYQPIIDIKRRRIHGYEALLRVNHPLISDPSTLMTYAEKLNILRDVSFAVHRHALARLKHLPKGQRLFINLHPKDFIEYENLDDSSNPFYRVDLSKLVLEVTERYLFLPHDRIHSIIRFFKDMGASIALDDLGSGFSNLEMLTNLAPNYIKLDSSLIRDIHRNHRKQKLVKSLFYYCEQIGCACISEGIESAEEFSILSKLDSQLVQGFYLARPAENFLSNRDLKKHLAGLKISP